MSTWSEDK